MDTTYRLTQTGKQVQDLLDQVTPNEVNIAAETQRATAAEQAIHGDVSAETTRAESSEAALQGNIEAEANARQSADIALQGSINTEASARQSADAGLQGKIDAEEARAKAAEQANATDIDVIESKIPSEASAQNQLADKSYVNSSVATATATFKGTYNLVSDLHLNVGATRAQIITELNATIQNADSNDYCFVQIPVATSKPTEIAAVDRYKFNGNTWAFEYSLNNSGYTEAQWDAINSGITSGLVTKLNELPTNSDLVNLLAGKQDVLTFDTTPRANSTNPVTSEGIKAAIDAASSADALDNEIARATAAEQANASAIVAETNRASAAEGLIQGKIDAEETARQSADAALQGSINTEASARQSADAGLQGKIDAEEARAKAAEQANATDIDVIESKIPSAATSQNQLTDKAYVDAGLAGKQDALTFDQTPTANSKNPVTSTGIKGYVDTAVGNEETRAKAAEQVNALAIDDVEALIPTQASAQNQLADKAFVNSSIATNTGDFVGTYNSLAEMQADNPNPNNNDYGYVVSTDQQGNQSYSRYKYSSSSQTWEFEYALNNSSFTADEWAAIQSGITAALVGKLGDLYTKAQLDVILDSKQSALTFDNVPTAGSDNPVKSGGIYNALAGKEDTISDLASIRSGASAGATAYQLPSAGIPKTDLASGVQDSLDAADTAYQKPSTGIPETDLDAATQQKINTAVDISGKADKVSGATAGDFAGLDANGNLTDSGKKASDFATAAQGALADTAYQKPSNGIPSGDMSAAVQTSLGKADTALQEHQSLANYYTKGEVDAELADKQDVISDLATIRSGAAAGATAYQKPTGGIPSTDLASAVNTSLGKADTAYQKPSTGIPSSDMNAAVQTSLGKADTALQSQVNSDWDAVSGPAAILNKPSIPTKMSDVASISVVAISTDTQSSCSIIGSDNSGKCQTIIYTNNSGSDLVVTVPTTYATPDGAQITVTVKSGGYCEVNYLNMNGTIYARAL